MLYGWGSSGWKRAKGHPNERNGDGSAVGSCDLRNSIVEKAASEASSRGGSQTKLQIDAQELFEDQRQGSNLGDRVTSVRDDARGKVEPVVA